MAAALIASISLAACSADPEPALKTLGPSGLVVGDLHPYEGQVQRFAFPIMVNKTTATVTVTDFKILLVPQGIKVNDYQVYSFKDTKGEYPMTYRDAMPDGGIGVDLTALPNTFGKPFTIKPGKGADHFAMVRFTVLTDPPAKGETLSDCQVTYTVRGQEQRQVLPCKYRLGGT